MPNHLQEREAKSSQAITIKDLVGAGLQEIQPSPHTRKKLASAQSCTMPIGSTQVALPSPTTGLVGNLIPRYSVLLLRHMIPMAFQYGRRDMEFYN